MEKHQQQFSLWYFVITFALLVLLQAFLAAPHVQPLDYSEFKTLLRAGNIAMVTLGAPYLQGHCAPRASNKSSRKTKWP